MAQKKRSILIGLLVVGAVLAGLGNAAAAETTAGAACPVAAATFMTPQPLNMSTLHPECCRTISRTPEATCDSISYSQGRCEEYNGGGQCAWTCNCCVSKNPQYSNAYCAQFDQYGADRCNQVWQGTACEWAC